MRVARLAGGRSNVTTFRVDLLKPLASKERATVVVETVFSHSILPYPRKITQVRDTVVVCTVGRILSVCATSSSFFGYPHLSPFSSSSPPSSSCPLPNSIFFLFFLLLLHRLKTSWSSSQAVPTSTLPTPSKHTAPQSPSPTPTLNPSHESPPSTRMKKRSRTVPTVTSLPSARPRWWCILRTMDRSLELCLWRGSLKCRTGGTLL